VVGDKLTVQDGAHRRSTPLTTLGDLAAFADVAVGLRGSYSPATSDDPDTPLLVQPEAAHRLATWFGLGDAALRRFAEELGRPQDPVLWPEHLDLGITVDGVNYGCSPGDDAVPEPYLYVGPHAGPPATDSFWNVPFGAAVTDERVGSVGDCVGFFLQGRALTERNEP
jgi:hypothetical protein